MSEIEVNTNIQPPISKIPHSEKWSTSKKVICVVSGAIENLLLCGVIFGWSALQYVYKKECYFIDEQTGDNAYNFTEGDHQGNVNISCSTGSLQYDIVSGNMTKDQLENNLMKTIDEDQAIKFSKIFVRSQQAFVLTMFIFGCYFDKYGTRIYRLTMMVLYVVGCILGSYATRDNAYLLFATGALVHIGGMNTYVSNLKIPSVLPKIQGSVIQLLNGGLEASAATFLIAKFIYSSYNISPTIFWRGMGIIAVIMIGSRTTLMPFKQFRSDEGTKDEDTDDALIKKPVKQKTVKSIIFSKHFFFHVYWFMVCDFWNFTFINSFLAWSEWINPAYTSTLVNGWGIYQFIGAPMAVSVGIVFDFIKRKLIAKTNNEKFAILRGTAVVLALTSVFAICTTFLSSIRNMNLQWVTFTIQITFRACLYGNNAQALLVTWPPEYFGKLYGCVVIFELIGAEMADVVLAYTLKHSTFAVTFKLLTGVLSTTLVYPAFLYYKSGQILKQ